MESRFLPRGVGRLLFSFAAALLLLLPLRAQAAPPPEESRPYLELPFAGETAYEVSCGYGCYQHKGSMWYAVDFAIPEGAPILAAAPGTIMAITWEIGLPVSLDLGDALIVYIDHGGGWFTRYVHLSGVTVSVGESVGMGDVIGYSGKTGASGDHLHFELKHGTSLHSASVPIDELFGEEPLEGGAYLSNNLPAFVPGAVRVPEALPTAVPTPRPSPTAAPALDAPALARAFDELLPQVAGELLVSESRIQAGSSVTVTFTIQNRTEERLYLAMLGVTSRPAEDEMRPTFAYDRSIYLNPGRTYTFERSLLFDQAGEHVLELFALGTDNEWLPLGGGPTPVTLVVEAGATPHRLLLPTVRVAP